MSTARRRSTIGLALVVVTVGAVIGVRAIGDSGAEAAESTDEPATGTAAVTRRDLAERAELTGTLGYGDTEEISRAGDGVITDLPALGTVVERGHTLVEVDGVSVPLWYGDRPLWRALDASSADGPDVRQVEENLVALGFATEDTLTVDEDWTAATSRAVREWQESLAVTETGRIEPGDVVMRPGALRVAAHPSPIGASAAGPVVTVTGTARQVTIDVDASKQTLVDVDQPVEVVLPDGTTVAGTIASVGQVAEADDSADPLNPGTPTVEVIVDLDDVGSDGSFDQAPVTVRVTTSAANDVLAVPVDALLALAEGGYAVERVTATGTELVAVDAGAFADGWVEVTGDVAEGDEVVVPA